MGNISSILNQHWTYAVKVSPDLKKVLPSPPMISFSRPKNLRDILVRAQLPPKTRGQNLRRRVGFKRCNMLRCETCPYTKNTTTHTNNFNKSYPITEELSCFTENTIYSLTCTKGSGSFQKKPRKNTKILPLDGSSERAGQDSTSCASAGKSKLFSCHNEAQYIRKTSQQFTKCMGQHRNSVSTVLGLGDVSTLVGFNFSLPGHSLQHMQYIAIKQVKNKDPYVILA